MFLFGAAFAAVSAVTTAISVGEEVSRISTAAAASARDAAREAQNMRDRLRWDDDDTPSGPSMADLLRMLEDSRNRAASSTPPAFNISSISIEQEERKKKWLNPSRVASKKVTVVTCCDHAYDAMSALGRLSMKIEKFAALHLTVISSCKINRECLANPGFYVARSAQLFRAALKYLGYTTLQDLLKKKGHYIIATHGTCTASAISGICLNGFDTSRRNPNGRQRFGKGEYFDAGEGNISSFFTFGDIAAIIVTLIVTRRSTGERLPQVSFYQYDHKEGDISLVENPTDVLMAYCLPIGILPLASPDNYAEAEEALVRVRTDLIEANKQYFAESGKSPQQCLDEDGVLEIPESRIQREDETALRSKIPCLDFINGTCCKGTRCPFSHSPELEAVAQLQNIGKFNQNIDPTTDQPRYKWQYFDAQKGGGQDGGFHDYDASATRQLEMCYDENDTVYCCETHSGWFDYEVDFRAMQQKNKVYGTIRKIRRIRM